MSKPFNIHDWQAKQRLAEDETPKGESMSNADIRALQTIISNYNLNKILNTLAVIVDRTGKHDEAKMIKKLINQMNEMSTTASVPGYQTPFAFKKKRKKDINEVSYSDFKRNTESSPRQKIARGISQVNKMIKEIEKIVSHNFRLKTELDMNSGTFLKSTNKKIYEIGARLKQLENKLREFSN